MQSAESGKKRKNWQRRRENKSPEKQYQENSKKAEVSETENVEDTSFLEKMHKERTQKFSPRCLRQKNACRMDA